MTCKFPDPTTGKMVEGSITEQQAALEHILKFGYPSQPREQPKKDMTLAEAQARMRQQGIDIIRSPAEQREVVAQLNEAQKIQKAVAEGVAEALAKQQAQQQTQAPAPQAVSHSRRSSYITQDDLDRCARACQNIRIETIAQGQYRYAPATTPSCGCPKQQPMAKVETHEAKPAARQHVGYAVHDSCGSAVMLSPAEAQARLAKLGMTF